MLHRHSRPDCLPRPYTPPSCATASRLDSTVQSRPSHVSIFIARAAMACKHLNPVSGFIRPHHSFHIPGTANPAPSHRSRASGGPCSSRCPGCPDTRCAGLFAPGAPVSSRLGPGSLPVNTFTAPPLQSSQVANSNLNARVYAAPGARCRLTPDTALRFAAGLRASVCGPFNGRDLLTRWTAGCDAPGSVSGSPVVSEPAPPGRQRKQPEGAVQAG